MMWDGLNKIKKLGIWWNVQNIKIVNWTNLENSLKEYDIIINATSLGLKNGENFDFDFKFIKDNLIYIDTIYNPLETKTLKYLKEKEKKVFNGLEMFIYQGKSHFIFGIKLILRLIKN